MSEKLIDTDAIVHKDLIEHLPDIEYLWKDFKRGKRQLFVIFFLLGFFTGLSLTCFIMLCWWI